MLNNLKQENMDINIYELYVNSCIDKNKLKMYIYNKNRIKQNNQI